MGALADLRDRTAAALAPTAGDPWTVHPLPIDAISPPAFMLTWSDPWLSPATHCMWTARLDIVAIANRVDAEPGIEMLETLLEAAAPRLAAAGLPAINASQSIRYAIGGVVYLASRLTLNHPVPL